MKNFKELSEREILALAISLEEEDEKVYANFADGLRQDFPATAAVFDGMRQEESGHRRRLIELSQKKFGDHIPLVRRQDVRGFVNRKPVWLIRPLRLDTVRNAAESMEAETRQFYEKAAARARTLTSASCWTISRRKSDRTRDRAEQLEEDKLRRRCPRKRGRGQPPPLRAANRAAGPGWPDGRLGFDAWPRFSRRPSPPTSHGTPSWSGWRHRSAPASAWVSPKRFPTMAASLAEATPGCAASSAA